jgi:RHS repeat-associated protein
MVRVGNPHPEDKGPAVQYQLGDHLGSNNLAINEGGSFINREEYTPYGETSFGSFARKRYRFTGKERDEESGLYYHMARYYAPWVARWVSCDPAGMVDGLNLYKYVRNNPLLLTDPKGSNGETVEMYHRTTSRGATGVQKNPQFDVTKPHGWAGAGIYGSSQPDIPGYSGYDPTGKNTVVRQKIRVNPATTVTLSAEQAAWLQDTEQGKNMRIILWKGLGLEKYTNQPSTLRDLITQMWKTFYPGKNVIRWEVAGAKGAYNYLVLSETAFVGQAEVVGEIGSTEKFIPKGSTTIVGARVSGPNTGRTPPTEGGFVRVPSAKEVLRASKWMLSKGAPIALQAVSLYFDYKQIKSQETIEGQVEEASAFGGRLAGAYLGAQYGAGLGFWGMAAGAILGGMIGESGVRTAFGFVKALVHGSGFVYPSYDVSNTSGAFERHGLVYQK